MKSKCNSMSLAALPADPPNQNHCNMKKNMKTSIINLLLLPALIAGLNLIPAGRVTAQTFTTMHSFTYGSDGANPAAGLILSSNTLYGTAVRRRQRGQWHGVRRPYRWRGFYEPV